MKRIICLLILVVLFSCKGKTNCTLYNKDTIPKNLHESLDVLDCQLDEQFKSSFKNKEESKAISSIHFGLGMNIRNNWRLWDGESELFKFFKEKGITHPDNISSIILTSYHRKLKNKEIDLESQLNKYYKLTESHKVQFKKKMKEEKDRFDSFQIGEKIKLVFSEHFDENGGTISYLLKRYDKEAFSNCLVKGYIVNKTIDSSSYRPEYLVDIKAEYLCEYKKVKFDGRILRKGDTIFNYSISSFNIEKN